jgi:hypothetical protein
MQLRLLLERTDAFYPLFIRAASLVRPGWKDLIASRHTDIVIEGFPRSANTFFYHYFATAQRLPMKIAHHLHSPYQIRAAARYQLPCVFLIRNPLDCITSAIVRDARLSPRVLLHWYQILYATAQRHVGAIVVVPQKLAISDPNFVIGKVNARYARSFDRLPKGRLPQVVERIEQAHLKTWSLEKPDPAKLALPSPQKDAMKEAIGRRLRADHSRLLDECQGLFLSLQLHELSFGKGSERLCSHSS